MTDLHALPAGYYWCTHDLAMWIPDGQEFPREWHVVHIADGYVSHAGADVQTKVGEAPDYVSFYGPLEGSTGAWQSIDTAPKDGTKIDVWDGHERVADVAWHMHGCWDGEQSGPAWSFQEWHHDERHWHEVDPAPTHWMPIPEGP